MGGQVGDPGAQRRDVVEVHTLGSHGADQFTEDDDGVPADQRLGMVEPRPGAGEVGEGAFAAGEQDDLDVSRDGGDTYANPNITVPVPTAADQRKEPVA